MLYSPTCPASHSAASAYQSRSSLSAYPGDGRQCRHPLRFAHATRLRAAWGAARVWTFVGIGRFAVQPDLTDHKLEPVKSLRVPGRRSAVPTSTSLRACNPTPRRLGAACRLCRFHLLPRKARNVGCIQPDLPGQPQCGLHLSKPVRSFVYADVLLGRRKAKRHLIPYMPWSRFTSPMVLFYHMDIFLSITLNDFTDCLFG